MPEALNGAESRLEAFRARKIARGRLLAVMAQVEIETRHSSFAVPAQPAELIEAQDEMQLASAHLAELMSLGDFH